jgi:hypothetical protein
MRKKRKQADLNPKKQVRLVLQRGGGGSGSTRGFFNAILYGRLAVAHGLGVFFVIIGRRLALRSAGFLGGGAGGRKCLQCFVRAMLHLKKKKGKSTSKLEFLFFSAAGRETEMSLEP